MANIRVQVEVENWVRDKWMRRHFGTEFEGKRVRLTSGGFYDADAVSKDGRIVAAIATGSARTSGGRLGVGKMLKIRADRYFLLLAEAERRLVVLTEPDMFVQWSREREAGRVVRNSEFVLAELPGDLRERLERSKKEASDEVQPKHRDGSG
jgi:hypothetical protein